MYVDCTLLLLTPYPRMYVNAIARRFNSITAVLNGKIRRLRFDRAEAKTTTAVLSTDQRCRRTRQRAQRKYMVLDGGLQSPTTGETRAEANNKRSTSSPRQLQLPPAVGL